MRMLFSTALLCAAFTLPALADPATPTTPPAPAAANPDQVICIRKAAPTGSIIPPKSECHTRAEWQAHPNAGSDNGASEVRSYGTLDATGHANPTP